MSSPLCDFAEACRRDAIELLLGPIVGYVNHRPDDSPLTVEELVAFLGSRSNPSTPGLTPARNSGGTMPQSQIGRAAAKPPAAKSAAAKVASMSPANVNVTGCVYIMGARASRPNEICGKKPVTGSSFCSTHKRKGEALAASPVSAAPTVTGAKSKTKPRLVETDIFNLASYEAPVIEVTVLCEEKGWFRSKEGDFLLKKSQDHPEDYDVIALGKLVDDNGDYEATPLNEGDRELLTQKSVIVSDELFDGSSENLLS
jgi:hypothetical protein